MGFDFNVEDAGGGWFTPIAETLVVVTHGLDPPGHGPLWSLIVPGSGLIRLQGLDAIKKRAESMPYEPRP